MRLLILGGSGMLGHRLWLAARGYQETYVTVRRTLAESPDQGLFDPDRVIEGVVAEDWSTVLGALVAARPDVVINCIGVVKQRPSAQDPLTSVAVNSLLPHQLARICRISGIRLIHLSTDCVFSGRHGKYTEQSEPDPLDLYGRSKLLGEVSADGCLTLRTSIIGWELASSQGLIEWFVSQRGKSVSGYTRAIFSGLTTTALSNLILDIIKDFPALSGLRHVAAAPISKYDLLCLTRDALSLNIQIEPDEAIAIDRSLDDRLFRSESGLVAPSWPSMIEQLARDRAFYGTLRR